MELEHPYLIENVDGFTTHISRLICMMNYARWTTLQAVEGLSTTELDARPNNISNSIGMLLEHMAEVEMWYQANTFGGNYPKEPGVLSDHGRQAIRGRALEYYLARLARLREKTMSKLAERDDSWLHETAPFGRNGSPANNYFKWFHVFEDELNHRGQIRLIRKMLDAK